MSGLQVRGLVNWLRPEAAVLCSLGSVPTAPSLRRERPGKWLISSKAAGITGDGLDEKQKVKIKKPKVKKEMEPIRMTKVQNTDNINCWWTCGAIGILTHCW